MVYSAMLTTAKLSSNKAHQPSDAWGLIQTTKADEIILIGFFTLRMVMFDSTKTAF